MSLLKVQPTKQYAIPVQCDWDHIFVSPCMYVAM